MLYAYMSLAAGGGGSYVKEMTTLEAFAQLSAHELGPFTEFLEVEPRSLAVAFIDTAGHHVGQYESDDPSELLPLIAAIGYSAAINGDESTVSRCRELLTGSNFVIDPQRIEDAWRFNKNTAIALAVADITPTERLTNSLLGPWAFALKVATLFYDQPDGYREELLKELAA